MKIMILAYSDSTRIWLFFLMELIMKVSGTPNQSKDMEEAIKFGVMEVFMKAIGRMIRPMVEEDLFMQTEISMMVIGKMTKLTDLDNIHILTVLNMKAIG